MKNLKMSLVLFLIFILVPVIEIYLFIEVGGAIGGGLTILLILTTAVIGVGLARLQGIRLMLDARQDLAQGRPPVAALGHGAMLLLSGALLITPGFFTDSVGFILLVPGVRRFIAEMVLGSLIPIEAVTRFSGFSMPHPAGRPGPDAGPFTQGGEGDIIIDTDYEVHNPDAAPGRNDKE